MSLAVASADAERSLQLFAEQWSSGLDEEQLTAARAAAQIVIDPEAAETTCPACLTSFATGPLQCPDCGLSLG